MLLRGTAIVNWYGHGINKHVNLHLTSRVKIAAEFLRGRVVRNISRPVFKFKNKAGRTVVDPASRSKPGEFPKADTTRLMKDIFWKMEHKHSAIIGTTLDYGLILETRMNRSFLRRSLNENLPTIRAILLTPPNIKTGTPMVKKFG